MTARWRFNYISYIWDCCINRSQHLSQLYLECHIRCQICVTICQKSTLDGQVSQLYLEVLHKVSHTVSHKVSHKMLNLSQRCYRCILKCQIRCHTCVTLVTNAYNSLKNGDTYRCDFTMTNVLMKLSNAIQCTKLSQNKVNLNITYYALMSITKQRCFARYQCFDSFHLQLFDEHAVIEPFALGYLCSPPFH